MSVKSVISWEREPMADAKRRGQRIRTARRWFAATVWPLVSAAILLAVWQGTVDILAIPRYVLPRPAEVWNALVAGLVIDPTNKASFCYQLVDTLYATFAGFLIAAVVGVVLAAMMAEFRLFQRIVFPYVVCLQSLPKVAIAPLFIIWFGYQSASKIAMATTITLFPILLNSLEGFKTIEPERLELMVALGASRWQTFYRIKLPSALPFVFTGLNLGIAYALLGAIVAEFLGAQRGVGVMISQLQAVSDTAGVFALLVVLVVVSYLLISFMRALQRRVVFWSGSAESIRSA
jgi:NitT/TauT family transport system permease protein